MFFIVSKLLAFAITPIVWLFVLLLIAVFSKSAARKKKLLLWTVVILYFFSNRFILDEFLRHWEVPAVDAREIKTPYDAGIVLGGVISYDSTLARYQFFRQGDRIHQAVLLYKEGKIKKILFAGGAGALSEPENKEGPRVKSYLLELGIPEQDILIEGESRNTRQNALFSKALIDKTIPGGNFLLITSALHQRRAVRCFEKAGIHVTPYSVDRYTGPKRKFDFDYLLLPDARSLFDWENYLHEVIGLLIYKVVGYA